jgi:hypothetical protein
MVVSSTLVRHLLLGGLCAWSVTDVLHIRASSVSRETFGGHVPQNPYPSAMTAAAAAKKTAIPIAMIHRGLRTVMTFTSAVASFAAARTSAVVAVRSVIARPAELADEAAEESWATGNDFIVRVLWLRCRHGAAGTERRMPEHADCPALL